MKCLTLFAGGGGADLGLRNTGINTVVAIEREQWIALNFKLNFPETTIIIGNALFHNYSQWKDGGIDLIWASPPCTGFSNARDKTLPDCPDNDAGWAIVESCKVLNPNHLIIENVPPYLKSEVYQGVRNELFGLGYWLSETIVNAADFGIPQNRKRLIVRGVKSGFIGELRGNCEHKGWYKAIEDLIPQMSITELADWQKRKLGEIDSPVLINGQNTSSFNPVDRNSPSFTVCASHTCTKLLLPRDGCDYRRDYQPIEGDRPSPTLRAMGHGGHCRQFDLWDGIEVRKLSVEGEMRLQSFPDNYQWLPELKDWQRKKIVGNSVPPLLAESIVKSFIEV